MTRKIENATDLQKAWHQIVVMLRRDLTASRRFGRDPLGTLEYLGFSISPAAAMILAQALP
jgi:hypothetical protein